MLGKVKHVSQNQAGMHVESKGDRNGGMAFWTMEIEGGP